MSNFSYKFILYPNDLVDRDPDRLNVESIERLLRQSSSRGNLLKHLQEL